MCCHSIFEVRGDKILQDSQKNIRTIQRKLYYAKEGVPMGRRVPKWQNQLMKTAQAIQPLHEQWTMLNELIMLWFKRTDRLLSLT